MKIPDKMAVNAMGLMKRYCREHQGCKGCNLVCIKTIKDRVPCDWKIPKIENVSPDCEICSHQYMTGDVLGCKRLEEQESCKYEPYDFEID